jgi:bacterioferritin-associated ferredoxin
MEEIICYCKGVSRKRIEEAVLNGAKSLADIRKATGACTGNQCKELNPKGRCCSGDILKILDITEENSNDKCNCCDK